MRLPPARWVTSRHGLAISSLFILGLWGCDDHTKGPVPPDPVTPPSITCPANITTDVERAPVAVTFANPVVTDGAPPVTTECTLASGAMFPAGTTDVVCSATDALLQKAQCVFHVAVNVVPRLQGTSFLAFGDSITEGEVTLLSTRVQDVQKENSYPTVLLGLLKDKYRFQTSSIIVQNSGLSGKSATTDDDRFLDEVRAHRPEAVLLLEGTNDVNDGLAASKILDALRGDVRRAYSNGVKMVFWSTLLPEVPGRCCAYNPNGILELNELIRASAPGDRAILVDAFAAFDPQKELLIGTDGLHPTVQGYAKLAEVFLAAIAANFQQPAPASAGFSLFTAPSTGTRMPVNGRGSSGAVRRPASPSPPPR